MHFGRKLQSLPWLWRWRYLGSRSNQTLGGRASEMCQHWRVLSWRKLISSIDFGLVIPLYFWREVSSVLPVSSIPVGRTRIILPVQANSRLVMQPGPHHICFQEPPSPSPAGITWDEGYKHPFILGWWHIWATGIKRLPSCRGASGSFLGE